MSGPSDSLVRLPYMVQNKFLDKYINFRIDLII